MSKKIRIKYLNLFETCHSKWKKFFKPKPKPPDYRIRPNIHESYDLEQWDPLFKTYSVIKYSVSVEEAERIIQHKENGATLYYEESKMQ